MLMLDAACSARVHSHIPRSRASIFGTARGLPDVLYSVPQLLAELHQQASTRVHRDQDTLPQRRCGLAIEELIRVLFGILNQLPLGEAPINCTLTERRETSTVQGSPPVVVCNRPSRIAADEASGYHFCGSGDGHGTI